ncbi:Phosphatidylinositol 3- and 4-kinase family protein [Cryptosporidium meleagridis]|uniref:Phosphatidylinositol 3-and 4-kinase family protein n=1 Tax=Cryptosporidium meleagridis TaxID=93969 RepID=A0A2P4Z6H1_9CRYT|nr:Phosphatidylinositol 3- and 4-kinase family protein [Cryptosporidium meleagridis]
MNQINNFPVAQQVYFSTHNALRAGENEIQKFVLYIDELDGTKRILLSIYPFYDCQMVKRLVIKYLDLPEGTSIRDIQLFYRGVEIPNNRFMHTFEKQRHPLHYSLRMNKSDFGIRSTGLKWSSKIQKLVVEVKLAMQRNVHPKLTLDGTGATYRMYNAKGQVVAMFKPLDEEAFSPNNPRGYQGKLGQQGFRSGVLSGEGASREVATAIWDAYYHNFAGVPDTTLLEACHQAFNYDSWNKITLEWGDIFQKDNTKVNSEITVDWKLGAFQEFISTTETVGNFNPSVFCIRDVHRIGILDICLFNLDRNDSNILVVANQPNYSIKFNISNSNNPSSPISPYEHPLSTPDGKKTKYKLIPIDHGLCLPDVLDVAQFDWVWFDWPHSKIPFSRSELRVIKYMDPDADAERLKRKLLIRSECLRSMRVSVRWLRLASSMHLNLYQIAGFLCREDLEIPSSIELLIQRSLQHCYRAFDATALISSNRLGNIHIDLATTSSAPNRARVFNESPKKGQNTNTIDSFVDDCELSDNSQISDSESEISSDNSTIKSKWWESRKRKQKSSQSQKLDIHSCPNEQLTPSSFQKSCLNGVSRSTAYRTQLLLGLAPQNATWMLLDRENNIIPIQWGDKHFEHVFFEVLEQEMKHLIIDKHPKWEEYPYFGEEIFDEGKNKDISAKEKDYC